MSRHALAYCLLPFLFAMVSFKAGAQHGDIKGPTLLYEHEQNFGVMAHTRGMGFSTQFTKHRDVSHYRLLDFNLYYLRHPKEIKLPNPYLADSRSYVFGKINHLTVLKANYGMRWILADINYTEGVRVNFNFSGGPVGGLLTPVYYNIKVKNTDLKEIIIQRKFDPENTIEQQATVGAAHFPKGLDESSFILGGNGKASFSFEWGTYDHKYYSIETGVQIDAFPRDVPIFAIIENQQVFTNLFLTLSYGSRR